MNPQDKPPVIPKPPPPPPLPLPKTKPLARGSHTNRIKVGELLFRFCVFTVVAISVALAWWMFSQRLLPRQKQSRELSSRVSRFSQDVDELERQWSETEALQVSNKYAQVPSNLFVGPAGLESWWVDLKGQAMPLKLDVMLEFGDARPQLTNEDKIALIPTTLALDVQPSLSGEKAESPYQRVLRLCQRLTTGEKRADLAQLSVAGGTNSANRAVMVLELWAGEEKAK